MKNEQEKTEWMQKPVVVWLGAMLCCFLWGSAFPCIKIGYKLWEINSLDTASQIPVRRYAVPACGHTGNRARKYA